MSGAMSRRKGARAEVEVAAILTEAGFPCSRNARNGLSVEDLAHAVPGVLFEVKRVERLNVGEAMRRATVAAASSDASPVVVHRRSREEWLATVRLSDLLGWWSR